MSYYRIYAENNTHRLLLPVTVNEAICSNPPSEDSQTYLNKISETVSKSGSENHGSSIGEKTEIGKGEPSVWGICSIGSILPIMGEEAAERCSNTLNLPRG